MSDAADLTLEQFLALHPWPAAHAKTPRLEWFWTFDVAMRVDDLWEVVADTSRTNRALGVSEMKFEDRDGKRWGTSKPGGVQHAWVEVPWSWVAKQWLTSVRLYEKGFSKVVYAAFRLTPREGGKSSRLYAYFGAIPSGMIGKLALTFGFPPLEKAYRTFLPKVAAEYGEGIPPALRVAAPPLEPSAEARLRTIREALYERELDRRGVDELLDWIRTGDEQDLHRIQMRERARAWRIDEDELLRICLYATRAGLLELSWDLVCPHCRGVTAETTTLGVLPAGGSCEVCQIDFGSDALEAVEITFHVHPSVRDIPKRTYCSAEPATKDHIRVQQLLEPGERRAERPALPPGRYRMRIQGSKRYGYLDVKPSTEDVDVDADVVWRASDEPIEHEASAAQAVQLVNDTDETKMFVIERSQWNDIALRPGKLLSFQDFRDLFSEEYLAADVQLAIGEQTILFTDMVGSTAMYLERGDPAAFVEVKRHFVEVFRIIAKHRGAVVKTIGDAAMGAFNSPLDAVKAAKAIHDHFHGTRQSSLARLRISLHTGPCIAVRLNTELDYFGNTVNLAAKLQALCETWQIAMSETTYGAPGVAQWIAGQAAQLVDLAYSSKALPEPIPVKQWTVHPS